MRRALSLTVLTAVSLFLSPAQAADITVKAVQYPAWVEKDAQKIPLTPGMSLKPQEVVASGKQARVLLTLPDGSEIKLGETSRFKASSLQAKAGAGTNNMEASLQLLTGSFRFATTTLAKLSGQRKVDVQLASATIGLRGTDYWAMVDAEHEAVCLFEGKVEVAHPEQGLIPLDQPTAFWVRYFSKPPQAPGNATAEELKKFLGWVEMQPGNGVAVEKGRWRVVVAAESAAAEAQAINGRLREQGYPSALVKSYGLNEVRISDLATRADAESLLKRLTATPGLTGANSKIVATR